MYDDLILRLRDAAKMSEALAVLLPHSEGNATAKLYNEAADAIKELMALSRRQEVELVELTGELASKPRWIPVTERLPEDLTRVIVFCEDGVSYGLCEHLVADDEEVVEWHDFLHYPITPTHWMPLPEPPKENEHGSLHQGHGDAENTSVDGNNLSRRASVVGDGWR